MDEDEGGLPIQITPEPRPLLPSSSHPLLLQVLLAIHLLFTPLARLLALGVSIHRRIDIALYFLPSSRVTLMRRTLPGIFSFEYELPTPYNVTETPKSVDLENELPSVLQFEIGPSDIGGTLSVQLQLDHSRVSSVKDLNYLKTQEKK